MDPQYLVHFGLGAAGGLLVFLFLHGILALKLYRLQIALAVTQNAVLGLRNSEKANKRWDKERTLQEDMDMFEKRQPVAKQEKFANDPLSFGG